MPVLQLKEIIIRTLQALNSIGAIVKVLVCDQVSNNAHLFSLLKIVPSKPYFEF